MRRTYPLAMAAMFHNIGWTNQNARKTCPQDVAREQSDLTGAVLSCRQRSDMGIWPVR
jgi:hypothetical protein